MTSTRALTGLAATALAVALPLTIAVTPADAAPAKHHTVSIKGKDLGNNRFKMVGTVSPNYKLKRVQILRQPGCKGKFSVSSVTKTDASGIFQAPIYRAKGTSKTCWKAKAPATPGYAPALSAVTIRIYSI